MFSLKERVIIIIINNINNNNTLYDIFRKKADI